MPVAPPSRPICRGRTNKSWPIWPICSAGRPSFSCRRGLACGWGSIACRPIYRSDCGWPRSLARQPNSSLAVRPGSEHKASRGKAVAKDSQRDHVPTDHPEAPPPLAVQPRTRSLRQLLGQRGGGCDTAPWMLRPRPGGRMQRMSHRLCHSTADSLREPSYVPIALLADGQR